MSDTNTNTDQLNDLADFLWEMLTDQPPSAEEQQQQLTDRLVNALEEAGFRGVSNDELAEALGDVETRLRSQSTEGLNDLSLELNQNLHDVSLDLESSLSQDFDASIEAGITQLRVDHVEPLRVQIENMPDPIINQITNRHITNNVTNVDDRQVLTNNNLVEEGGVLIQANVQSDDGSIAVGGDVNDSAVNSGEVDGVQAAGDVELENSVVGDDNTTVLDSDVDNLAIGGDAVSVETAPAPEPVVEPVVEEVAADAAFDDAAAAEAEAAAIESELDV